ncbi:MAG: preprotein translocase subunit SecG [Fusobacteriaceae bacterium]
MESLVTVVLFISAVALIGLVLIQPDRTNGMTSSMGSGASTTIFGISKDGGPLAKATTIAAIIFVVSALVLYIIK